MKHNHILKLSRRQLNCLLELQARTGLLAEIIDSAQSGDNPKITVEWFQPCFIHLRANEVIMQKGECLSRTSYHWKGDEWTQTTK